MKKLLAILISALLMLGSLSLFACSKGPEATTYDVTVQQTVNGTLSVDSVKPELGTAVNITATADTGFILYKLTINGNKVSAVDAGTGVYTYVISSALNNYVIDAVFARPNVTIKFVGVETPIQNKSATYNATYGTLPVPFEEGKRFVGWKDSKGLFVYADSAIYSVGEIVLTAQFEEMDVEYKEGLIPDAITSTYFDAQATKYGVTWHTSEVPSKPVIQVSKTADFAEYTEANCTYRDWNDLEGGMRYSVYGVVEGLDFDTEYFVRFGDAAIPAAERATYWSKTYNFTTRSEEILSTNFFFLNGTNQRYTPEHMGNVVGEEVTYRGMSDGITPWDSNTAPLTTDTYWSYVMKAATAKHEDAAFTVHGGEMVSYTMQYGRWDAMISSVEEYLFDLPVMGTTGQIEVSNQSAADTPMREGFGMMFNIDAPHADTRSGMYYSFDYGSAHILTVRTADLYLTSRTGKTGYTTEIDDQQIAWLKNDLDKAKKNPNVKWIVVYMNESPLDIDQEFRDGVAESNLNFQEILKYQILPIFDEYGVDLVLAGSPRSRALVSSKPVAYNFNLDAKFELAKVTTTTETYEGQEITTYSPIAGSNKGIIYHQTGVAGPRYYAGIKEWDGSSNTSNPNAVTFAGKYFLGDEANYGDGVYRKLLSGDFGVISAGKAYSMYSYVEITANSIVVRTYGVDVNAMAKAETLTNLADYNVYLDGFKLTK